MKDFDKVNNYMHELKHPLLAEIEVLRGIIKGVNNKISERIKWNAPSYYYKDDFLTFNLRLISKVHLIFHHKTIPQIKSEFLEGDYKDRRMMYFENMEEIVARQFELERIINEQIRLIDKWNQVFPDKIVSFLFGLYL
jgi:uncharacterized protein YdhG (YjbR/CyaY superfamily)